MPYIFLKEGIKKKLFCGHSKDIITGLISSTYILKRLLIRMHPLTNMFSVSSHPSNVSDRSQIEDLTRYYFQRTKLM